VWRLSRRRSGGSTAESAPPAVDPTPRDSASPIAAAAPRDDDIRAIEKAVRRFLTAYRIEGDVSLGRLARSRNLWREVSSLTLLQLVAFVERRFAIKVRPIDFAPQNFESVSAIARFVAARRVGTAR
jgi:hypothetical protein